MSHPELDSRRWQIPPFEQYTGLDTLVFGGQCVRARVQQARCMAGRTPFVVDGPTGGMILRFVGRGGRNRGGSAVANARLSTNRLSNTTR